jgi:hypothetical protein
MMNNAIQKSDWKSNFEVTKNFLVGTFDIAAMHIGAQTIWGGSVKNA